MQRSRSFWNILGKLFLCTMNNRKFWKFVFRIHTIDTIIYLRRQGEMKEIREERSDQNLRSRNHYWILCRRWNFSLVMRITSIINNVDNFGLNQSKIDAYLSTKKKSSVSEMVRFSSITKLPFVKEMILQSMTKKHSTFLVHR